MIELLIMVWNLLFDGARDLLNTDFNPIQYRRINLAFIVGSILIGTFFLKLLVVWWRRKHSRGYPGYDIPRRYRLGLLARVAYAIPKAVVALGICFLLVGLADPYLVDDKEVVREIESQIRIDLVDTSTSMWEQFPGSDKSKAQVARETHLKFLELRKDKSDIVSFWLFSSNAFMEVDFTTDYNQYFLHVYGAPYILYSGVQVPANSRVSVEKVAFVTGEGGTDLRTALQSIIKQYDNDPRIQEIADEDVQKAILITTDAETAGFPGVELNQLKERNIVPIILFINDNTGPVFDEFTGEMTSFGLPRLVQDIGSFGGKYFDVSDENSLQRAYDEIDKMEKVGFKMSFQVDEIDIYQRFVIVGFLLICLGLTLGFIIEPFLGIYP